MAFIDLLVVVMLVAVVALVVQNRRAGSATPPAADPEALRLADEVRELRARIQVLERVITDTHGSTDLSTEIERLRDR